MQEFSIHDVRFRRAGTQRCLIVVHGQTVGDVQLLPAPDRPDAPDGLAYRIRLYDSPDAARLVHRRSQVKLAIADSLWQGRLVPAPVPAPIAARPLQLAFAGI